MLSEICAMIQVESLLGSCSGITSDTYRRRKINLILVRKIFDSRGCQKGHTCSVIEWHQKENVNIKIYREVLTVLWCQFPANFISLTSTFRQSILQFFKIYAGRVSKRNRVKIQEIRIILLIHRKTKTCQKVPNYLTEPVMSIIICEIKSLGMLVNTWGTS